MNASEQAYYKVRCTKTGEVITVYTATTIHNGYVGWLVNNPFRCRFDQIDKVEYETLKTFFEA